MSKNKVTIGHVFKTIIWPRKKLVLFGLFLTVVSRVASLVVPGSLTYLIDDVVLGKEYELLKPIVFVVALAVLVQAVTSFLLTRLFPTRGNYPTVSSRPRISDFKFY